MTIFHAQKSNLRVVRRVALGLISLFLSVEIRAAGPSVEGTMPEDYLPELKEILQTALKQSPQMILKEIEIAQAEAARYGADAPRFPTLSGGVSYDTNQSSVSSNTNSKSKNSGLFYSLSLAQPIFQWGALKNQSEIGKLAVLVAQRNYDEYFRLLASNLRSQYLSLVVKKAALATVRFRQKIAESTLEVERQKLSRGTISAGEMIAPELALEDAKILVARYEEDFAHSKRLFAHTAGYQELGEDKIAPGLPKAVFTLEKAGALLSYLRNEGGGNSLQAEIYALNSQQAELNYKIARVRNLPKFALGASTSQSNSNSVANSTAGGAVVNQQAITSQSAGIRADINIFDGFATKSAKLSALASKRYYERLRQIQIQTTLDQAQNLERLLAITTRNSEVTERRLQLAEGGMRRVEEEVKLGNAPGASLDTATAAFYESAVAAATARAEFFSRWSDFVSLVGVDPVLNTIPAHNAR